MPVSGAMETHVTHTHAQSHGHDSVLGLVWTHREGVRAEAILSNVLEQGAEPLRRPPHVVVRRQRTRTASQEQRAERSQLGSRGKTPSSALHVRRQTSEGMHTWREKHYCLLLVGSTAWDQLPFLWLPLAHLATCTASQLTTTHVGRQGAARAPREPRVLKKLKAPRLFFDGHVKK